MELRCANCVNQAPPGEMQKWITEGLQRALDRKSHGLTELVLSKLDSVKLSDPAAVLALVEKIPTSEKSDPDWKKSIEEAKVSLKTSPHK
jgi:hypothetical protein